MTRKTLKSDAAPVTTPKASGAIPVRRDRRPRRITRREAQEAAARIQTGLDGKRIFLRFSLSQRLEHQLLIVSFTALAVTGLPQRFANTDLGGLILQFLGGIETARQMHHLFAMVFALECLYHITAFVYGLVVHGRWGSIWPALEDVKHFIQMLGLNLGLSNEHPRFGRYTFEEKMEYWALVWGSVVMIATGIIQWFPTLITRWLPGAAIPIARAVHGWEAILAVLAIVTWHLYHVALKHFNRSIFTGIMTEEEMREEHPAELAQLERAAAMLRRPSAPVPTGLSPARPEPTAPMPKPAAPVPEPIVTDHAFGGRGDS